jgi:hypothetical protein
VHPRKVFFYLTNQPRMPLPENSDDILPPSALAEIKRLTPSISDPSVTGDDMDIDMRGRSPSPEVELFSPDLEDDSVPTPPTPGEAFSGRNSLNPDGTPDIRSRPNRAPSPALEADERGFTETATAVRARGMSLQGPPPQATIEVDATAILEEDETPEQQHTRDRVLAHSLFGSYHNGLVVPDQKGLASSPMIAPRGDHQARLALTLNLDDIDMTDTQFAMRSPETIDVDELDSMLTGF